MNETRETYKVGDIVKIKTWDELQHVPCFVGIDREGELEFLYDLFTQEMEKALKKDRTVKIIDMQKCQNITEYAIKLHGHYYHIYPEWIKKKVCTKEADVNREKDIILKLEKFVDKDGIMMYRIKEISLENIMTYEELPQTYLAELPYFYRNGDELFIKSSEFGKFYVPGKELSITELNNITSAMTKASRRLRKIRDEIRKTKEEWNGEVEIII